MGLLRATSYTQNSERSELDWELGWGPGLEQDWLERRPKPWPCFSLKRRKRRLPSLGHILPGGAPPTDAAPLPCRGDVSGLAAV